MHRAAVLAKSRLGEDHWCLVLRNPFAAPPLPGQFLEVAVRPPLFLRRPLSIASCREGRLVLLVRTVGPGTRQITDVLPGQELDIIGPLGRGFDIPGDAREIWLAGGGTGIAPLLFLAERLAAERRRVTLFYGARRRALLFPGMLPAGGYGRRFSTDDGSFGTRGPVTALLERAFRQRTPPDLVCASGPYALLRAAGRMAAGRGVPCLVTVENRMACGMGLCFGCVIAVTEGGERRYERVCTEGPVFPASRIAWDDAADADWPA